MEYFIYFVFFLFLYLKNFLRLFWDCLKFIFFFLGWLNVFGVFFFGFLCWFVWFFFFVCILCFLFLVFGSGIFGWCCFLDMDVMLCFSCWIFGIWDWEVIDWERGDGMLWCWGFGNCRCFVCLMFCFFLKLWIGYF